MTNTTTKPGVLASLDQANAALSQNATFPADAALARTAITEARATVQEMAHHTQRLLAYIDSAHGDQFRELIEQCAAPGSAHIEGLRAALAAFKGEQA